MKIVKIIFILLYIIIYNNIRFFITFYFPCISGENKTEIEIEMAGAVFRRIAKAIF